MITWYVELWGFHANEIMATTFTSSLYMPLNALMESILQQRCVDGAHGLIALFTKHMVNRCWPCIITFKMIDVCVGRTNISLTRGTARNPGVILTLSDCHLRNHMYCCWPGRTPTPQEKNHLIQCVSVEVRQSKLMSHSFVVYWRFPCWWNLPLVPQRNCGFEMSWQLLAKMFVPVSISQTSICNR